MIAQKIKVFDPTADDQVGSDDLANRLNTFDGKVVGLLNNTKDRTDVILNQIAVSYTHLTLPTSDLV